jgi:hypothetical protein
MGLKGTVLIWTGVALVWWLDGLWSPSLPIVGADFGDSNIGSALKWIGTLWGIFGDKVSSNLKSALGHIRNAIIEIGKEIARFARAVALVLARVAGILLRAWRQVIKPFLARLDGWILRVFKWLKDTFGPVIEFLVMIRNEILKFYTKWLKPILDTIDVLRRILSIASLLGIDAARKLDAKLAELERRIRLPLDIVIRKINEVIDVVDRIMTLDGLVQRVTLIRSLIAYQRDALAVWWTSIHKPLTEAEKTEHRKPLQTRSIAAIRDDFVAYVVHDSGPDRARIDEHARDFAIRVRAA